MKNKIRQKLKQLLCEHEYRTLYPYVLFRYEREQPVRYWVCRCEKCGKVERIESRKAVQ